MRSESSAKLLREASAQSGLWMLKINPRCFEARPESTQENSSIAARIVAATALANLRFSAVRAPHASRASTSVISVNSASRPPREPERSNAATATVAITASTNKAAEEDRLRSEERRVGKERKSEGTS